MLCFLSITLESGAVELSSGCCSQSITNKQSLHVIIGMFVFDRFEMEMKRYMAGWTLVHYGITNTYTVTGLSPGICAFRRSFIENSSLIAFARTF